MLFYIKCPSCSRIISTNLDKYFEDLDLVRNDPKTTRKEKELDAAKLLDKYGYRKICCRARILGMIPYHKIIQT